MPGIEAASPAPERKGEAGPESSIASSGIEVPACAAGSPDGTLHSSLYLCVERFLNLRLHFYRLHIAAIHRAQAVQDVLNL